MRKYAYSWGVRIILGVITVVFVFWGIGTGFFAQVHPVALVDGKRILPDQVDREAELMRRSFQNMYGPQAIDLLKHLNLRQQALDHVINDQLVDAEARRLGLRVSDADLRARIESNRAFQLGNQFDFATYEAVLRENGYDPAQFEDLTRSEMTANMLRDMVSQTVIVSDEAARQQFNERNQKLSLAYIELNSSQFTSQVHPTADQISHYYNENGDLFRIPEKIKVAYLLYDPVALGEAAKPSDKEIADYYKTNLKQMFSHPDQVRARHILVSAAADLPQKDRAKAKDKAEKILDQLKHGADFAKLAQKESDDPGSARNGGDLGFFSRGQMVKPFEDAAFKLKPGQLSDLVETRFGYHIIRVDEVKPAHTDSLEEARPKITEILREQAGRETAHNQQRADLQAALSGTPLKALASKRTIELNETPLFSPGEPIGKIGSDPEFQKSVAKLGKGDVSAFRGQNGGFYLVQLTDREPSHIPPLKQIQDQVRDAFVRRQAEDLARDKARAILKQIKEPADFSKVAAANHLEVQQTGQFDRSSGKLPKIGDFPEIGQAVGELAQIPGMIPRVMIQGGNAYIFEGLSRNQPAPAQWQKDAPQFKQQLLEAMRGTAWDRFMDGLKHRARITIDTNQLGEAPTEASM